jgi:hypothetical protein
LFFKTKQIFMSQQNPHKDVLQDIFDDAAFRLVFASFNYLGYDVTKEPVKKDAAKQLLNSRIFPFLLQNESISDEDKRAIVVSALEKQTELLKNNFSTVLDFIFENYKQHGSIKDFWNSLRSKEEKK